MQMHTNKTKPNWRKNPKPNIIHLLSFILRTPKNARNIYFYLSLVEIHPETNLVYICYIAQYFFSLTCIMKLISLVMTLLAFCVRSTNTEFGWKVLKGVILVSILELEKSAWIINPVKFRFRKPCKSLETCRQQIPVATEHLKCPIDFSKTREKHKDKWCHTKE